MTGPTSSPGEGGTISAFFYNPQLAEGISFGHYLRDADQLYDRLLAIMAKDGPASSRRQPTGRSTSP